MPRKVIVDTDPGVDDVLALLLLLASPEISIELISVTFGNTTIDHAFENVLKVYSVARGHLLSRGGLDSHAVYPNLCREKPTLLARGATGPIEGGLDVAEYFHGFDGLSNISETNPEFKTDLQDPDAALSIRHSHASDVILEILASEPPNTVTILALGPLTTIAMTLRKDPETFARVAEVVSMGGALDVTGNTSPTAEFNFFADPYGAEVVMRAATDRNVNMVLLPLDITTRHPIHFDKLIRPLPPDTTNASKISFSILQHFLNSILTRPRKIIFDLGCESDHFEMHDPLAAYYVIDGAMHHDDNTNSTKNSAGERWKLRRRTFLMERQGEWTKGSCIVDRRGTKEVAGAVRSRDGVSSDLVGMNEEGEKVKFHGLEVMVVTESPGLPIFEALLLSRVVG